MMPNKVLGTGFLVYVFSIRVLSMAVLVDFIGLYQGTFWPILSPTTFGHVRIRKDYIGISHVVFPCSFLVIFLVYYLSYSCIILG